MSQLTMSREQLITEREELLRVIRAALEWYGPRLSPGEPGLICRQLRAALEAAEQKAL
jgi:predicted component of type VI protein secretion system